MSEWQPLQDALKGDGRLPCPEPGCIRDFTLQRGLDQHLRLAHRHEVVKNERSRERREYQREYQKRARSLAYQREYRKRKRRVDPELRARELERASRRAAEKPEEIRFYQKARAAALKVLVRRHRDEYRLLLEVARERIQSAEREDTA